MRKLIFATTTILLAATCAAAAALPRVGVRFTGPTSAKVVNGFGDTVTFLTGRTTLKRFSFGTLGCFGYGTFPVGVDPYGISIAQLKAVPLSAKGTFAITSAAASYSGGDASTKLKVTINGKFSSATAATGVISIVRERRQRRLLRTGEDDLHGQAPLILAGGSLPPRCSQRLRSIVPAAGHAETPPPKLSTPASNTCACPRR